MQKIITIFFLGLLLFLADLYVFQATLTATQNLPAGWQNLISGIYWSWFALTFITLALAMLTRGTPPNAAKTYLAAVLFIVFTSKLVIILFLLLEDAWRLVRWLMQYFSATTGTFPFIPRNQVWSMLALLTAAVPFSALIYGMVHGAFYYQVKKVVLKFPNLPLGFHGFKMVQISDLHTGSFASDKPLKKAVKLINDLEADLVVFTGDLVNNVATELEPYSPILGQLKGKLGVYSILGNHDYGDYVRWPDLAAKRENLERLKHTQARMGWRLLLNEHAILNRNGDQIALLGVENWGNRAGFPKYGILSRAYSGTEALPFRVLLSHDPSHWTGEVTASFPDIDLTLSGHTHGMQFGVNLQNLKWSPVQYVYRQWAGLYQKERQYLYVNVGLGFIGYPGRVGFLPEITLFELQKT